jgi:ABC-type multidrug transport system ATPase subunit
MARIAREGLVEAWGTGDGRQATEAIQRFSEQYSNDLRTQSRVPRDDENAYREWEQRIARWLYSVDHIRLVYSLEYEGLDVQRLSPGTRGIVLLLLYLAVDQSETDPLIIDQPEENLDPESVYSELVSLFRRASVRRQIVMVTHNANLVVNTDVDQVLVAHAGSLEEGRLPELTYLAGGLERPDVRTAVCDVLEGGAEAFRQRAQRLHIDLPGTSSVRH